MFLRTKPFLFSPQSLSLSLIHIWLIYTDSTLGKFVNPDRAAIAAEREKYLMRRTAEFRAELERCGVGRDEFMSLAAGAWSEKGSVEKK